MWGRTVWGRTEWAELSGPEPCRAELRLIASNKMIRPRLESDHVLAQAFNLYVGGHVHQDIASLQHSDPVSRILGACLAPEISHWSGATR